MNAQVVVVGIGADGWAGLDEVRRRAVWEAEVLLGGERHLAMVPDDLAAVREPWPRPLRTGVSELLARHEGRRIVALASGDPLVAGVGTTLIEVLGAEAVTVLPAVSSVALARARMGWPAETVAVVRDHRTLPRELSPGRRVLVLSADSDTPGEVARMLRDAGFGASAMTILSDLGATEEARSGCRARDWAVGGDEGAGERVPPLHVLAVECAPDDPPGGGGDDDDDVDTAAGPRALGLAPGLPDDAFENDGQLTRRDLRASALSRLAPAAGHLLWDVGAGAGSVGIEWMRTHPSCRAVAVEADPTRAARIARNASRLGVPALEVVEGRAPAALDGLPRPDAVFVGGGGTAPGLLRRCWHALAPGGRLVAHAVTVETEQALWDTHAEFGGEMTRFHVEHADAIGSFTGWAPARAVTQWAAVKPPETTAGTDPFGAVGAGTDVKERS
ncbi:precorrin-6Y C5,15-methyltransferase [Dietzia sp. NCCP-2495]|uniref:precorrin-6y C5,15-methyltransferase (decarboxylating) subunit CbiE n=1 Tax=Dietzia sp. NCCP-2495 TaxID=2934675 RepID=UPI00222FDB2A|nr:precorrin-6y C5,15-methyltransferase (decarboxylating) subunit CbiE [Dietzia sp. NCCP-2495]GLB63235.1 precorrin-6Y C5,15-methyltransferase [Dietzia sp. NCCP-2495]